MNGRKQECLVNEAAFGFRIPASFSPRVQVPNNHILSNILTYITTILPEYLIIGSLGPLGFASGKLYLSAAPTDLPASLCMVSSSLVFILGTKIPTLLTDRS